MDGFSRWIPLGRRSPFRVEFIRSESSARETFPVVFSTRWILLGKYVPRVFPLRETRSVRFDYPRRWSRFAFNDTRSLSLSRSRSLARRCIGIRVENDGRECIGGDIGTGASGQRNIKKLGRRVGGASGTKQLTPWLPPTSFLRLLFPCASPSSCFFFRRHRRRRRARFPPLPPSCRPRDLKTIR